MPTSHFPSIYSLSDDTRYTTLASLANLEVKLVGTGQQTLQIGSRTTANDPNTFVAAYEARPVVDPSTQATFYALHHMPSGLPVFVSEGLPRSGETEFTVQSQSTKAGVQLTSLLVDRLEIGGQTVYLKPVNAGTTDASRLLIGSPMDDGTLVVPVATQGIKNAYKVVEGTDASQVLKIKASNASDAATLVTLERAPTLSSLPVQPQWKLTVLEPGQPNPSTPNVSPAPVTTTYYVSDLETLRLMGAWGDALDLKLAGSGVPTTGVNTQQVVEVAALAPTVAIEGYKVSLSSVADRVDSFPDPTSPNNFMWSSARDSRTVNRVEEGSTVTFNVVREGDLSKASKVSWSAGPWNTAFGEYLSTVDASDFTGGALPGGVVDFAAGEATKTISFTLATNTDVTSFLELMSVKLMTFDDGNESTTNDAVVGNATIAPGLASQAFVKVVRDEAAPLLISSIHTVFGTANLFPFLAAPTVANDPQGDSLVYRLNLRQPVWFEVGSNSYPILPGLLLKIGDNFKLATTLDLTPPWQSDSVAGFVKNSTGFQFTYDLQPGDKGAVTVVGLVQRGTVNLTTGAHTPWTGGWFGVQPSDNGNYVGGTAVPAGEWSMHAANVARGNSDSSSIYVYPKFETAATVAISSEGIVAIDTLPSSEESRAIAVMDFAALQNLVGKQSTHLKGAMDTVALGISIPGSDPNVALSLHPLTISGKALALGVFIGPAADASKQIATLTRDTLSDPFVLSQTGIPQTLTLNGVERFAVFGLVSTAGGTETTEPLAVWLSPQTLWEPGRPGMVTIHGSAGSDTIDVAAQLSANSALQSALNLQPDPWKALQQVGTHGGPGNDTITGWAGRDHIIGGVGDDIINAGDGHDVVVFSPGNDVITGGAGYDTLEISTELSDRNSSGQRFKTRIETNADNTKATLFINSDWASVVVSTLNPANPGSGQSASTAPMVRAVEISKLDLETGQPQKYLIKRYAGDGETITGTSTVSGFEAFNAGPGFVFPDMGDRLLPGMPSHGSGRFSGSLWADVFDLTPAGSILSAGETAQSESGRIDINGGGGADLVKTVLAGNWAPSMVSNVVNTATGSLRGTWVGADNFELNGGTGEGQVKVRIDKDNWTWSSGDTYIVSVFHGQELAAISQLTAYGGQTSNYSGTMLYSEDASEAYRLSSIQTLTFVGANGAQEVINLNMFNQPSEILGDVDTNKNDALKASVRRDNIDGGVGVDTVSYADATLSSGSTSGLTVDLFKTRAAQNTGLSGEDQLRNVENVVGAKAHQNTLTGNGFNNELTGGNFGDTIDGGRGNDKLFGGAGMDTLLGGQGNDVLAGGRDADTLTGGSGADRFVFDGVADRDASAPGTIHTDTITDFNGMSDLIELNNFKGLIAADGKLDASQFVVGAGGLATPKDSSKSTYVRWDNTGSSDSGLYFYGDVDGDGATDDVVKLATFSGTVTLTAQHIAVTAPVSGSVTVSASGDNLTVTRPMGSTLFWNAVLPDATGGSGDTDTAPELGRLLDLPADPTGAVSLQAIQSALNVSGASTATGVRITASNGASVDYSLTPAASSTDKVAFATSTPLTVSEGTGGLKHVLLAVTRIDDTPASAATVNWRVYEAYSLTGGQTTASAEDFGGDMPSGTLSFLAGETEKFISIPILSDDLIESTEAFDVRLETPSGAMIDYSASEKHTARVVITNDDTATVDNGGGGSGSGPLASSNGATLSADGMTLTLNYAQPLQTMTSATAILSQFLVKLSGVGVSVTSGSVTGSSVTLNLGSAITANSGTVTVSYTDPNPTTENAAGTVLEYTSGADVPSIGDTPVVRLSAAGGGGGTITFLETSRQFSEGSSGSSTAFVFNVQRTGGTAAVSATWTVAGGSSSPADAADFGGSFPTGTVNFALNETSKTITVNVSGDATVEPNETFTVTLSNPTGGATLGGTAVATGTINNDDSSGGAGSTIAFSGTVMQMAEGNTGQTQFIFNLTRTGDTSASASVNWAVAAGTGNPATTDDFAGNAFPSGTVTFAAGDTDKTLTVNISGDTAVEPNETFTVTLSSPTGGAALGGNVVATGTINNDDGSQGGGSGAPTLVYPAVLGGDGTKITLTFSEPLSGTVSASNFRVEVDHEIKGVSSATITGSTVTLTLQNAITVGMPVVSVSYMPPPNSPSDSIRDAEGNATAPFQAWVDQMSLAETTAARDVVTIPSPEDSTPNYWLKITNFDVSAGSTYDVLNLPHKNVAVNVATPVNGSTAGSIAKHSVNNGMVAFFDASSAAVMITQTNLQDALKYVQTNFSGVTGAFTMDALTTPSGADSTVVFQTYGSKPNGDGTGMMPILPTVVSLLGTVATGVASESAQGSVTNQGVIRIMDSNPPEVMGGRILPDGTNGTLELFAAEPLVLDGTLGVILEKNGSTALTPPSQPTVTGSRLDIPLGPFAAGDWLLLTVPANGNLGFKDSSNNAARGEPFAFGWALGANGDNNINLSTESGYGGFALDGRGGNDTLTGSSLSDELAGGTGGDTLTGGGGGDQFGFEQGDATAVTFAPDGTAGLNSGDVFNLGSVFDRILDFSAGDEIFLSQLGGSGSGGNYMGNAPSDGMATDQGFFAVRGTLDETNPANKKFVVNTTGGSHTLLVWDGSTGSAVTQTAIVLMNVIPEALGLSIGSSQIDYVGLGS